ncbi:MAG TPA: class I tRNA ligase family protein, partial [Acidimicrobiales bacterium]|nr:class I tRNA ligase family protein [Acidimicrobiales bacterium]
AGTAEDLERDVHRTIDRISHDIERYGFNTAVAALMELTNSIYRHAHAGTDAAAVAEATDTLLKLLAPFAPHLAAEAYEYRHQAHVHTQAWPQADPAMLRTARATLIVQINGKLKDRLDVDADISEEAAIAAALASEKVRQALAGAEPRRVVARPPKLVNVVA